MEKQFLELNNLLQNNTTKNEKLNKAIHEYSFLSISGESENKIPDEIMKRLNKSKVLIIDQIEDDDHKVENKHLIISFERTIILIMINQLLKSQITTFFSNQPQISICFLSNSKETFEKYCDIHYSLINFDKQLQKEISILNQQLLLIDKQHRSVKSQIWEIICSNISCYLILKSYLKLHFDRIDEYNIKKDKPFNLQNFKENDFIQFRNICLTNTSESFLNYHIENEQFYVIKKSNYNAKNLLLDREKENYTKINHPFIPNFYGTICKKKDLVIEFIYGKDLGVIESFHFNIKDKFLIIFQLLLIFQYLHENNFVYRDLKPSNLMISQNKELVLIDFDRMIKMPVDSKTEHTAYFSEIYGAPEVNYGTISFKNDIYSIGQMIYFIINEKDPSSNIKKNDKIEYFNNNKNLLSFYTQCTNKEANKRPFINYLIIEFYTAFSIYLDGKSFIYKLPEVQFLKDISFFNIMNESSISDIVNIIHNFILNLYQNDPEAQNNLGLFYCSSKYLKQDINKALHYFSLASEKKYADANFNLGYLYFDPKYIMQDIDVALYYFEQASSQNNVEAHYYLGRIYYDGKYVKRDINEAIRYLLLAANQNHAEAQNTLGFIYFEGTDVKKDISKAIHYLSLAADQGFTDSQNILGIIYSDSKYNQLDYKKALHYFTLAADKNHPAAQSNLGIFYYSGKCGPRDIKKAIHYLNLASNNNISKAQYALGLIYYKDEYIERNINKSIHYLTLAANSKLIEACLELANIYLEGKYVTMDADKAINYLIIAANQNNVVSQYYLGKFYTEGIYIDIDISKGIYYYSCAAKQNHVLSLNNLGQIYYDGKYVKRDVDKALHYLSIAADQNYITALKNLGHIYFDGKYVEQNLCKSVHYFSLAADQNDPESQYFIALIYYSSQLRDIKKMIYYLTLSADQNYLDAQFLLGKIYYEGNLVPKNIKKSIFYLEKAADQGYCYSQLLLGCIYWNDKKAINYLSLAAKQNCMGAQNYLGLIYLYGHLVVRDVYKAIYYFELAAKQNFLPSINNLGYIYEDNNCLYKTRNIDKALHFYLLAANQNNPDAQYNLGKMYFQGIVIKEDINKSIYYLKLAADQNHAEAQYSLGFIYLTKFTQTDVNKIKYYFSLAAKQNHVKAQYSLGLYLLKNELTNNGINYLYQSAEKGFPLANFVLGFLYHDGKYIKKDINQAIHYYKEASSFGINYAKNNLGIIYKNGYGENPPNPLYAILYFEDAIKENNDFCPIYNLAHIYLFNEELKNIDKSIELLIHIANQNNFLFQNLLCLAMVIKYKNNLDEIIIKINDYLNNLDKEYFDDVVKFINNLLAYDDFFKEIYIKYENTDLYYDCFGSIIRTNQMDKPNIIDEKKVKNISKKFYEGFGIDCFN